MSSADVHISGNGQTASIRVVSEPADGFSPSITRLFGFPVAFDELLDEIPMGVAVLTRSRRVVLLNQAMETLTGFSQQEARGIPCRHILRSDVCLLDCPALRIDAESGSVCEEGNLINRDRQLIPVRITSAPIRDRDGRLSGFLETVEDLRPLRQVGETARQAYSFQHIIGHSPEMEKIFGILPSLAQSDSSVLITGETGTGKDMVAETIHQSSNRAKGPFVKINCGALPETLLESELFGHRKGAFTGAMENKPGRFNMAHNGTLYLTEIGDLPLSLQVKLLTFLDDKVVFPLGSTKGFLANVRIIAATHHDLAQMVADNRFRKDLLYRLNVVRLHLPPLHRRQGDIRLLLDHFRNHLSSRLGAQVTGFSESALAILLGYRYPGNVRELRNIVEYAMNVCKGQTIKPEHLPSYLLEAETPDVSASVPLPVHRQASESGGQDVSDSMAGADWSGIERRMIVDALVRAGGRRSRAAKTLGWARSTLWRKMKQHGID